MPAFIQTGMTVTNRVVGLTGGTPTDFSAFEQSFSNIPDAVTDFYHAAVAAGVSVAMDPCTSRVLVVEPHLAGAGEIARVNLAALLNRAKEAGWAASLVGSEQELGA